MRILSGFFMNLFTVEHSSFGPINFRGSWWQIGPGEGDQIRAGIERDLDTDSCAFAGGAGERNSAAETFGSFRNAEQAKMAFMRPDSIRRRKAFTIIFNMKHN